MPEIPDDTTTRVFAEHRELLFSVVYNMLGSVADTEDVLQDTWLAWARRNSGPMAEEIANPRAYLVRIAVNAALARRATISRRRETYVGPWLPEPLVDRASGAAGSTLSAESVSMAMLVILESLTPLERAVFVLHEVFGYPHTEIAGILDRSPSAVRQLAHRAAALRPVHGRESVACVIAGPRPRGTGSLKIRYRTVNGDPSAVLIDDDGPFAVMVVDLTPDGDQVSGVYVVTNPDKLTRIEDEG